MLLALVIKVSDESNAEMLQHGCRDVTLDPDSPPGRGAVLGRPEPGLTLVLSSSRTIFLGLMHSSRLIDPDVLLMVPRLSCGGTYGTLESGLHAVLHGLSSELHYKTVI